MALVLVDEKEKFTMGQKAILEKIVTRVGDVGNVQIFPGKTDLRKNKLFLPLNDSNLSYGDLEGIACFEVAHYRFKSINDSSLGYKICPKNPELGQILIKITDDFRIQNLLNQSFYGFGKEFDNFTLKGLQSLMIDLSKRTWNLEEQSNQMEFLLLIIWIFSTRHQEFYYDPAFNEGG